MVDKKSKKSEKILEAALMLFASRGFYSTTIPDIAKAIDMSVGNIYNYFSSKEILAKEIIKYSSDILGAEIRRVNEETCSVQEKIRKIVSLYFEMASSKPQHINYFLRVYIANREVFKDGCEGMLCVSAFVTELMIFFEEGVACGELRNQDFFSAFGLFMGYLGGFVFLNGEGVLDKNINCYIDDIALNIYNALKQP
ncbi:MAG: TetR/AcrR family transcriptional regulator [Epsilonproteobacteria bacterium]|nr:MAG: TetR family transcriptional regulator [Sulfurospirillum sp. MES]NCB54905.1 TetR/AcrR family transcriptional regulator [Campylobacterota bacterium]